LEFIDCSKFYSDIQAYCDSKLAIETWASFLHSKFQRESSMVQIVTVHPGVIKTGLWDNSALLKCLGPCVGWMLRVRNSKFYLINEKKCIQTGFLIL